MIEFIRVRITLQIPGQNRLEIACLLHELIFRESTFEQIR